VDAKKVVAEVNAPQDTQAPAKKPAASDKAEAVAKAPAKKVAVPARAAAPTAKTSAPAVKATPPAKTKPKGERVVFFASQQVLLEAERDSYVRSAEALKAQADSLALEHEPGDVQFDEEGGEGGTATVDREMDLYLSAQARSTILEIDRALEKIADGSYGICEQCHQPIPDARLEALPYASMCVACKSGGLSSRR